MIISLYLFRNRYNRITLFSSGCGVIRGMQWITSGEAAEILGVSTRRARELARAGRIEARKFARDWLFDRASVKEFAKLPRTSGNPDWIAAGKAKEGEEQ